MIRLFGNYVSRTYLYLGILELAVFFSAFYAGVHLRFAWTVPAADELADAPVMAAAAVFAVVMFGASFSMGLYQRGVQARRAGFIVRLVLALLLGTVMLTVAFYLLPSISVGRGAVALALLCSFIGVIGGRAVFIRFAGAEARKRRVLVLGAGANAEEIEKLLAIGPEVELSVVGYVPLAESDQHVSAEKRLESGESLLDIAIAEEVDEIVVAADDRRGKLPVHDLLDCKMSGFDVLDLLTFFEKQLAIVRIDLVRPSWIIFSTGFRMGMSGLYGKRLFDLLAGGVILAVSIPFMALVAVASLIESRGRDPVLYRQVRVGQGGKLFRLSKFRSMRVDAEADGVARWASQKDPRVTRLGAFIRKTRLDELPQIFNVLKGDMSLVGPRPERPEFVDGLSAAIPYYGERHRVKPGLTGWAQLLYPYGSGEEDAKRKLEYDLYYVKHAGIVLDLVILLQTVEVVLFGKGAR